MFISESFFIIFAFVLLILSLANNKYIYFALCLLLFMLSAFRGFDVGTDTTNNLIQFEIFQVSGILKVEPLWYLLLKCVDYLGGDFRSIVIVSSGLVLIPIFIISYKVSKNPTLSLFFFYTLYFFFYSLNITRQSIAISFILVAIVFLNKNRKILFFLFVIMAGLFHYTAFITLLIFFLKYFPTKRMFFITSVSVSFIIGVFFSSQVLKIGSNLFSYDVYADLELGSLAGNAIYLVILNLFFIFNLYTTKKYDNLFMIFFIYIIIANLFGRISVIGSRVAMNFGIIQIIYFVSILYNNRIKEKEMNLLIFILFALIMFALRFGEGGIFPYSIEVELLT